MHTLFRTGGEDEFFDERILHGENFPWRGKFPGAELFRGNFTLGEFSRSPIEIFLCVLLSLYRFNFPRGDVKGSCLG